MVGKRLVNTGGAGGAAAFDPLQNFETVTYTGNGSTQKITGYIRKGAAFNGSSSYIDTNYTLPADSSYSISCWFNTSDTSQMCIYSDIDSNANSPSSRISLRLFSSGNFGLIIGDGSSSWIHETTSSSSYLDGNWHHIVQVVNGTSIKLYADGNTTPIADLTSTVSAGTAGERSIIFGRLGHYNGQYYNGKLDQVRIFDKAISSSEVTTLYNETYDSSTKSTTDIFGDSSGVALYELDEDAGDSSVTQVSSVATYQLNGNANDLTTNYNGFASNVTYGTGQFSQAAIFNGSTSYIDTTYTVTAATTQSISLWFKTSSTGNYRTLFSDAPSNGAAVNTRMQIYFTPTSTFEVVIGNNSGYWIGSSNSIASYINGNWHHLTATYNGTSVKVYLDGSLFQSFTSTISFGTAGNQSLVLGKAGLNNVNYWSGSIDQVRIYNAELLEDDVDTLYNESLADSSTNLAFDVYGLYSGTPTNVNFLGMAFQPDLVWWKNRDTLAWHQLHDSVRGAGNRLFSNDASETQFDAQSITSFDTNGFTIGTSSDFNGDCVAWCWKAGGAAVSNTDGSITSSVSANPDAGFSIVKYTGNGNNSTVGHGLSVAPDLIITKGIDSVVGNTNWLVYNSISGATGRLVLNQTGAFTTASNSYNNTEPTSSVFTIGTTGDINGNGAAYIAYCFHSVDGYQKVGSYTGTGATGNSVTTGFRPRWIMIKRSSSDASGGNWIIKDSTRDASNPNEANLYANLSAAEEIDYPIDFNDTGFTIDETNVDINKSGGTYIYLAIA